MTRSQPPAWWTHREPCPTCGERHVWGENARGYDPERRTCAAHNSDGERRSHAPVPGSWVCRFHGGRAPQVAAAAAERTAVDQVRIDMVRFGEPLPVERSAEETVLMRLAEANGLVEFYFQRVREIEETHLTGPGSGQWPAAVPHVLVGMLNSERDRSVVYAKAAHDMGIEERQIRLAESQGDQIGRVVMGLAAAVVRWLTERGVAPGELVELEGKVPEWISAEVSKMRAVDVGSEPAHG